MKKGAKGFLSLCIGALLMTGGCVVRTQENAEKITAFVVGENGHVIEGTEVTLRLEATYEAEELSPSDPSGYFYYYEDKKDWHYYVVRGKVLNPLQISVRPEDFGAAAWCGKAEYEAKVVLENSTGSTFIESTDQTAAEEPKIYILVMVKDKDEAPDRIEFYYNKGLSEKGEDELWDHGLVIEPTSLTSGE